MTARSITRRNAMALTAAAAASAALPVGKALAADAPVRINPLIEKLQSGAVVMTPDDWTFLDNEHTPYLIGKLVENLAKLGEHRKPNGQIMSTPIARLPADGDEDSRWMAKQMLDSGVMGIVFGHVESRAEAERAVKNMRYPPQKGAEHPKPEGVRGFGPGRAAKYWGLPVDEYIKRADVWPLNPNGELLCVVQIESAKGVQNVEEIVSTPGVGAILLGPSDLGMSMGVGPAMPVTPPETEKATMTVLKACQKHNVTCIYPVVNGEDELKVRLAQGYKMILYSKR